MAIVRPDSNFFDPLDNIPSNISFKVEEAAIGGKLLSISYDVAQVEALQYWDDRKWRNEIRHKLATLLAEKMIGADLCEINSMTDPITLNKRIYLRCYLAPGDQVKVIRMVMSGR